MLSNKLLALELDGGGVYGSLVWATFTIALTGSTLLIFFYLWRKGKLDMDQEPADMMLKNDNPKKDKKNGPNEKEK